MNFQILFPFAVAIISVFVSTRAQEDETAAHARFLGLDSLFGARRPVGGVPQIGHPGAVVRPGGPIGHPGAVVRPGYASGLIRPHVRPALVKPIHPQYFGSSLVRPGLIRQPLIKPAIAPQQRPSGLAGLFNWFG